MAAYNINATFEDWLAKLLGQDTANVCRLLSDPTGLHFLISWSLFEAKCFGGFLDERLISSHISQLIGQKFDCRMISDAAQHFHARYQDNTLYKNLMHGRKSKEMERIIRTPYQKLQAYDQVFLVIFTTYRFRNNIFHGNKKVLAWLKFQDQIDYCIDSMQKFIVHAESKNPTLKGS